VSKIAVLAVALAAAVARCASSSSDIAPAYVSPVLSQNYTCQQLAMEAQGVCVRAAQVAGAGNRIGPGRRWRRDSA
jgi:hypothetical protein